MPMIQPGTKHAEISARSDKFGENMKPNAQILFSADP